MKSEEGLTKKIEDLRTDLETIIKNDKELVDPEVLKASQSLDKVLIQYYSRFGIFGLRLINEGVE